MEKIPGTEFSVDFIVKILENAGFESSDFKKSKSWKIEDLTQGSAFFSKVLRLTFCFESGEKSVVLKVPGVQKMGKNDEERAKQALNYLEFCHGNEFRVYDFLHSEAKQQSIPLKIPRVFYGADFSRLDKNGLLVMESVDGGTMPVLPGLTNGQVEAVVDEMAKIHVLGWKNPKFVFEKNERTNWHEFLPVAASIAQQMRSLDEQVFNPLMDQIQTFYCQKTIEFAAYKGEKYGFPATLVHSDLWSANIIFNKEAGKLGDKLVAIIDWQACHSGNPMVDIGRLLAVNTSAEYRRSSTTRLLQRYLDVVSQHMDPPFDLDQLKAAFDHGLVYVALFVGFGVPTFVNMPAVVGTGVEKLSKKAELLDRAKCVFEDVLKSLQTLNPII